MTTATNTLCDLCSRHVSTIFAAPLGRKTSRETCLSVTWNNITFSPGLCKFCDLLRHCLEESGVRLPFAGILVGVYNGLELQLHVPKAGTTRRLEYSIQRCKRASATSDKEARKSSRLDPGELKKWLERCDGHGNCSKYMYETHGKLPPDFRLIDVQDATIIRPTEFVKYCTLSYVWGSVEQEPLMIQSHQEYPIVLDSRKIPKTITDAMALCRDIGVRYLWVDSLCIAHDSESALLHQIHSMAAIYSQSYLSINAASGDDANAGLPPYWSRNPPVSYLIRTTSAGALVASLSPQIAAEGLINSKWASRGWTLQEYALPRKVVFFTGSYTFYRCEESLLYEDFRLGFSEPSVGNREIFDLPLPPFYRRAEDETRFYPLTFTRMLGQFLRRDLRKTTDIIHAFTGILTPFENEIGAHLWGLPSKAFAAALQWKTEEPFPVPLRDGFPSWSWSGWLHTSRRYDMPFAKWSGDVYEGFDEIVSNQSAVTCWMVTGEPGDEGLKVIAKQHIDLEEVNLDSKRAAYLTGIERLKGDFKRLFPSEPETVLDFYADWTPVSTSPVRQHLFVWASCASLYVDREPCPNNLSACEFALRLGPTSEPVGWVELRPEWRKRKSDHMEFFAATAGLCAAAEDAKYATEPRLKVILVEMLYNVEPPVYRRVQVSHKTIKLKDWELAERRSRLIVVI